ncbi:MAG TPA: DUF2339 domain-containing protein [Xanthobacteraceae bacterium]|nr:DUF2339 domain-containing protein [Xanthobacteraceae bacterium]
MEALGVLLIPLAIAYFVAPIAAFFMALGNKKTINELFLRVADLERKLALAARTAPATAAVQAAPPPVADRPAPAEESRPQAPVQATPEPAADIPRAAEPVTPAAAAPPPRPPETPAAAAPPSESFEQTIGTRWVVWVGGVALALGGIFLVSYAVDQGYVGPKVRLALAALLAAGLIACGEWARRNEKIAGFIGLPTAHVPSILTAAGTMIAFATVYAAYALYEFIGPAAAFVLLGAVAIATLAAALLHGPALAALGLVGAEVVPIMVSSSEPNYGALYIYLAVVTAAALALARVRLWRWLALTAVIAGALWTLPGIDETQLDSLMPHAFHLFAGFALVAALIVSGLLFGPDAGPGSIDSVSSIALGAYLLAAGLFVIATDHDRLALATFVILAAATVAIAWRTEAAVGAVPAAAVLASLVMIAFALEPQVNHLIAPSGPTAGAIEEPANADVTLHMVLGAAFAVLFGGTGFLAQGRSSRALIPILWAASGVVAPIAVVAALYYQVAGLERSIPFAGLSLLLAALFAVAVETLGKRPPEAGGASAQAIYATGSIAALALALTMSLDKGWLTIALALMAPGVAHVERQRPLPALRWLVAVIVGLVVLRIGWEPRIVGRDVGAAPIFNWLLYGYGVPALSFWIAGHLLRKRVDDIPARMADSAAILFTVLLVTLQIRHYVTSGNIYNMSSSMTEVALQVCAGLAMAIGLEHVRRRTGSIVHNVGAIVVAALTLCVIVFGLLIAVNPLLTPRMIGPPFINLALLGYGIPAVLAIALALIARTTRPLPYRVVAAATAVVLSLMYLTVQIARLFQGSSLREVPVSDAQQYAYSAAWLIFGVLLLVAGLLLPSKPARIASGAVIFLTVLKVFLFDMAGLTGIWRALSFIGLGLVLMGIGYLYQRLLFPPNRVQSAPVASP